MQILLAASAAKRAGLLRFAARLAFLLVCLTARTVRSQSDVVPLTTLHSFQGSVDSVTPGDGAQPESVLTQASDGSLYGTTQYGGLDGRGTIFRLDAAGNYAVIHRFVYATGEPIFPTGLSPGPNGSVYGATYEGGAHNTGTIFRLDADGTFTVLHHFAAVNPTAGLSPDGDTPSAPPLLANDGYLYGTTANGGAYGGGTVFRMATDGSSFTTLHSFGISSYDAARPQSPLVQTGDGNLYGTTAGGGNQGAGTIFQVSLSSGGVKIFYQFHGGDGSQPGALLVGSDGRLYGVAYNGGDAGGTIFGVSLDGTLRTVYRFEGMADSAHPTGLAQGKDGKFYGTTTGYGPPGPGGARSFGTLFRFASAGQLATLYAFRDEGDGSAPGAGVLVTGDGNLLGTTAGGGSNGHGTIFRYDFGKQPTAPPTITAPTAISLPANVDFTYRITTTGAPTLFFIQGLPGYFYQNIGTGEFGGLPYQAGDTFHLTVTASNAFGTASAPLDVTVTQGPTGPPEITSPASASGQVGVAFNYQITATQYAESFSASGLPAGLTYHANTGIIDGTPLEDGTFSVQLKALNNVGTGTATLALTIAPADPNSHPAFFSGEASLGNGVYYLSFSNGNYFGYYSYLADPRYIYHFDLGYEYLFDAADGHSGIYFYDFKSSTFFYTSPSFPFPYLYDFTLNTFLYYYPDPKNAGHYNTDGYRFFYRFDNGQIIVK